MGDTLFDEIRAGGVFLVYAEGGPWLTEGGLMCPLGSAMSLPSSATPNSTGLLNPCPDLAAPIARAPRRPNTRAGEVDSDQAGFGRSLYSVRSFLNWSSVIATRYLIASPDQTCVVAFPCFHAYLLSSRSPYLQHTTWRS